MVRHATRVGACLVLLLAARAQATPIYIGDAASQGSALTSAGGPRADTVSNLTYVSTAPSNLYYAPTNQQVTLTEVNFFADMGGTLRPFVARYNGGNNQLASSYSILAIGDPITVTPTGVIGPDATDHLVNAQFTVGGVNPVISLNAGDRLVAGWQQQGTIVYISGLTGSGVPEYIANGLALPGTVPNPPTMNSNWAFNRTMQFNIGLEGGTLPLKIMPLGDSITYGSGGTDAGYRGPLYTLLTNAGYYFQFVGSTNANPGSLPTTPLDQRYHEGHSGYVITSGTSGRGGLTDNIATWLGPTGADPDIILLMIGTNDVNLGYQLPTAPDRLSTLISMISDKTTGLKPDAELIVALLVPIVGPKDADVMIYNAGIASVIAAHQALGENVSLVDMHSALNPLTDMADALHPNNSGYAKMAQVWLDGIAALAIPEPATLSLLALGGLALLRRRRRSA